MIWKKDKRAPCTADPDDSIYPPSTDESNPARVTCLGRGWARTSINTVIFRRDSLTSHLGVKYAAFYGPRGRVVPTRRRLGPQPVWVLEWQPPA